MFASTSTRALRTCIRFPHWRHPSPIVTSRNLPRLSRYGYGLRDSFARGIRDQTPQTPEPLPFRLELVRESPSLGSKSFREEVRRPRIFPQIIFVLSGTIIVFNAAALATQTDTEHWSRKLRGTKFWAAVEASSEDMRRARVFQLAKKLQKGLKDMQATLSGLPNLLTYPILWSYAQLAEGYLNTTEGKRIAWQLTAVNGVVWAMWQVPRLQHVMHARFMHHPLAGLSYTLLTSMFSHKSFIHLLVNSLALTSFGSAAAQFLMREQSSNPHGIRESTPKWHIFAVFIGAGLFSGLVSHVVTARFMYPRLISALKAAPQTAPGAAAGSSPLIIATTRSAPLKVAKDAAEILPSLGASGAIYALVTMTALAYPDAQVFLLFPPGVPLPITWGVGGMVCVDIIGILRGWKMFDHWAHLGGAAFGAAYYTYGPTIWNELRLRYSRGRVVVP